MDELLLFGQLVGAYWSSWPPAACVELIGRAVAETAWGAPVLSYEALSLDEFRTFCAPACPKQGGRRADTTLRIEALASWG